MGWIYDSVSWDEDEPTIEVIFQKRKKHPIRLFVSVVDAAKKTITAEPKMNDIREGTAITVAD